MTDEKKRAKSVDVIKEEVHKLQTVEEIDRYWTELGPESIKSYLQRRRDRERKNNKRARWSIQEQRGNVVLKDLETTAALEERLKKSAARRERAANRKEEQTKKYQVGDLARRAGLLTLDRETWAGIMELLKVQKSTWFDERREKGVKIIEEYDANREKLKETRRQEKERDKKAKRAAKKAMAKPLEEEGPLPFPVPEVHAKQYTEAAAPTYHQQGGAQGLLFGDNGQEDDGPYVDDMVSDPLAHHIVEKDAA